MSQGFRLPDHGAVDRDTELRFTFDGVGYVGHPGDTLASALLAHGVHRVGTGIATGRPRGIFSAGVEEPNAIVQVEEPFPEPMLPATTIELYDGLVARGLAGKGRLSTEPDPARYDAKHAHCDVLVVGAGATGLTAALTAARSGARVILVDDQNAVGGALLGSRERLAGRSSGAWLSGVYAELAMSPEVTILSRTTAFGAYDDGFMLAVQRRTDHLGAKARRQVARQRIWRIRARQTIVATGAHERPLVFAGNDLPGVMLAGAARTYLHRYGVLAGRSVVVFTTNDSAYAAAIDLADAGVDVAAVVDVRDQPPRGWAAECAARRIDVRAGAVVTAAEGSERVSGVRVAALGSTETDRIPADLLLVSGGWNPVAHLFSQAGGKLRYDREVGGFVPARPLANVRVAGCAAGETELADCFRTGAGAAVTGLAAIGFEQLVVPDSPASDAPATEVPPVTMWLVPGADKEIPADGPDIRFVDQHRDQTVSDVLRATGAGLRSVEHVKRYTTIGTGLDQGRTSGVVASGIIAEALGVDIADLGTTTFRPPYTPVSFAALAGRDRGELHDPVRVTAIHPWHVAQGAHFENVGQWKRPWYYPISRVDGEIESMDEAVRRECRAAREGVAMMDGSTLGKIDVRGPDAAEFLNMMYTNMISSLAVGAIRYGLMCGVDGMMIDDGTVIRIAEDHFLITTTTGNAAKILEWLEEWLQTEWPQLRVSATSVTEHWVTIPLVGPKSRTVLAAVAPDLDVSKEAFEFMRWFDTTVAGAPAKVCRISFSGELAYEINVNAWDGLAVWEALFEAGRPYGITPYGTETMHVLRAEKGYPIVGQDTDGTVTPQDLGMSWAVSKKKADFIGKRSFARPENLRPDRKQLVGLLPLNRAEHLPEGAQIVAVDELGAPPVPMLGHVTSSYHSVALDSAFALALVRGGRARIGETLKVAVGDRLVPVEVTESVFYDKEGARRDG